MTPLNSGSAAPVLSVRDLNVRFNTENGVVHAVRGLNFDVAPGQVLGIVGESGSGKSVTSLAIMGLLVETAKVEGSITLGGEELVGLTDQQMCKHRGNSLAMVFQDPLSSLTPVFTIGRQITDAIRIHHPGMPLPDAQERAVELLTKVGIPSPRDRLKSYPHEFSGGMRQRVMIAIAMANNPQVLICDEPTTALDVTIQAQILDVLEVAQEETGAAVIMITHDLGVVAGIADDVMVMYAGRAVEYGPVDDIYYRPHMPYTMGLLASVPRVDQAATESLVPIKGNPPNLLNLPPGCTFAPRCPMASEVCDAGEPALGPADAAHQAACVKSEELIASGKTAREVFLAPSLPSNPLAVVPREERKEVLAVEGLTKHFPLTKGALIRRRIGTVKAVDGLTFDVRAGECLSIVGESGCGKTTTLLEIMEFSSAQAGEIRVAGLSNKGAGKQAIRTMRGEVQMVFQDPMSALDPRFTVYEVLAEPLQNRGVPSAQIRTRITELMELVGLMPDHVNRFPAQFSGGQRQRIGIARALAVNPQLVVLDEPVSALDVSIQAGVINLLVQLKAELGLSFLMVAHDLAVVRHLSDQVAVMYLGKIVEHGPVDVVFDHPVHPYTQALLSAIPVPDPVAERSNQRIVLQGDLPTPLDAPLGCSFVTRCPIAAALPPEKKEKCLLMVPPLTRGDDGRDAACFYPQQITAVSPSRKASS